MRNHLLHRKQIFTLMVFLSLFFNSFAQKESFSYRESYFPMVSASKAFQLKYDTMPLDRYWGLWGHNLYKWVEEDEASENEEIYAFIDDERNCDQFCFSSSILKEIIQKNIRKTKSAYTYYMVSPQDNTLVCQCEKCIEAGNTATNATKPATVETGATVNVPLFINEGDKIKVETEKGTYKERIKE